MIFFQAELTEIWGKKNPLLWGVGLPVDGRCCSLHGHPWLRRPVQAVLDSSGWVLGSAFCCLTWLWPALLGPSGRLTLPNFMESLQNFFFLLYLFLSIHTYHYCWVVTICKLRDYATCELWNYLLLAAILHILLLHPWLSGFYADFFFCFIPLREYSQTGQK